MKRIFQTLTQKWPELLLELVVITSGILGAYALNSWNDRVVQQKEKEKIYTLIVSDLEFTSQEMDSALISLDTSLVAINELLLNAVTKDDITSTGKYFQAIMGYEDIRIKDRGLKLLENSIALDIKTNDSLDNQISNFYSDQIDELDAENEVLYMVFYDFYDYCGSQPWFEQAMRGQGLDLFADAVLEDPEFRTRILKYALILSGYRGQLSNFSTQAKELIKTIREEK